VHPPCKVVGRVGIEPTGLEELAAAADAGDWKRVHRMGGAVARRDERLIAVLVFGRMNQGAIGSRRATASSAWRRRERS
jgi:hypothetical protein